MEQDCKNRIHRSKIYGCWCEHNHVHSGKRSRHFRGSFQITLQIIRNCLSALSMYKIRTHSHTPLKEKTFISNDVGSQYLNSNFKIPLNSVLQSMMIQLKTTHLNPTILINECTCSVTHLLPCNMLFLCIYVLTSCPKIIHFTN